MAWKWQGNKEQLSRWAGRSQVAGRWERLGLTAGHEEVEIVSDAGKGRQRTDECMNELWHLGYLTYPAATAAQTKNSRGKWMLQSAIRGWWQRGGKLQITEMSLNLVSGSWWTDKPVVGSFRSNKGLLSLFLHLTLLLICWQGKSLHLSYCSFPRLHWILVPYLALDL